MNKQIGRFIFRLVWWRWMKRYKIIKVKGWRTALVEPIRWPGTSWQTVTCCFWKFQ